MANRANDPAFPATIAPVVEVSPGMSIREVMATAALIGLIAHNGDSQENATLAVRQADDLIRELNK